MSLATRRQDSASGESGRPPKVREHRRFLSRGGETVSRLAHNQETAGANPTRATNSIGGRPQSPDVQQTGGVAKKKA